jgi:hypothetical protein
MRTLRSEVQRLIRECPDDPRVVLLPNGLTWMYYAAGEITNAGAPGAGLTGRPAGDGPPWRGCWRSRPRAPPTPLYQNPPTIGPNTTVEQKGISLWLPPPKNPNVRLWRPLARLW